ncbi:MAG: hypothetical protein ACLGIA_05270 [Actinomycetes bacterium]
MKDVLKDLVSVGRFTPVTASQRFAYACASLLVVSGGFHAVVYLVDGGPWAGPVSWRKPIVFGLSFGVTVATTAWFMTFLRPGRLFSWVVLGTFAIASVAEVFLISMQKWRGVASHFNVDTPFDGAVFSMMGALVTVVAVLTVVVTVRSFFRVDAPPSLAWAIRYGLVLMLVSQAVGAQMIAEGGNTFGAAGALKLPHAVTLHAAQVLPALAVVLQLSDATERQRLRVVALGAAGYVGLVVATMVETYSGRAPLDPGAASSALALVGLGLLAASGLTALRGLPWTRIRPARV